MSTLHSSFSLPTIPGDVPLGLWDEVRTGPLPRFHRASQSWRQPRIEDVAGHVAAELRQPAFRGAIRPGMRVAVTAGSRGIGCKAAVVRAVVAALREWGAQPFIIPAMGSHGGATPEGQVSVLAEYGITEAAMGAPIVSSLETREVGRTRSGAPVYFSVDALDADAIVLVNRIKLHTGFRGEVESGLLKILAIGLGKQRGAHALHRHGFDTFAALIPEIAALLMTRVNVAFGVGIVENAEDQPGLIEAIPAAGLAAREAALLRQAREWMPRIPFDPLDMLVVREMGKNISGCGMDPNVIGRAIPGQCLGDDLRPRIQKIVVLNLTPESHGNAIGMGLADVTTRRLGEQVDFNATFTNAITSGSLGGCRLPPFLEDDRAALQVALKTCPRVEPATARIAAIRSTLHLQHFLLSEALLPEAQAAGLDVEPEPREMEFAEGALVWPFSE
jgi:hypothetical protein